MPSDRAVATYEIVFELRGHLGRKSGAVKMVFYYISLMLHSLNPTLRLRRCQGKQLECFCGVGD